MSSTPSTRSIKIAPDERGGWSSDRPRRDGAPPRPADISVRSRILSPQDRARYSPGSLVVVVCASLEAAAEFADRTVEDRSALLTHAKVRALLAGRVDAAAIEAKTDELLDAAIAKRLTANESVVVTSDTLGADWRERQVRVASSLKRPRHLILLEIAREAVPEDQTASLNALRRRLDAGELGDDGFQTVMRLSVAAAAGVKRLVFRSGQSED